MTPEAIRRLQHELSLIDSHGVLGVLPRGQGDRRPREVAGIRCSGRGSAGDSIVSYALGITDADPVAHDLLFERFLNPERRQMPDIDVDFDSARRDEIIDFIYRAVRPRARRDGGHRQHDDGAQRRARRRALRSGCPSPRSTALSRHLPWVSARKIREVLATYPECAHHPLRDERTWGMLLDLAEQLDHCPMHLGTHLGGFIITRDPIASWTPLQWAAKGMVVSQYDKDDIEALGLVKMDILGLRIHSAISDAVEMARARVGEDAVPEPFDLPKDDPTRLRA